MTKRLFGWACALCALVLPALSEAAYTCSISSGGFVTAYSPSSPSATIVQTSFTVTCSRSLSDASTMSFTVAADNGTYSLGTNNRAAFGSSFIRYDVYKDGACGTQWKGSNTFTGTFNFGGSTSASTTVTYWGCIGAAQTGLAAGTYTDTVTMTLSYGPTPQSTSTGAFSVAIATPATCSLTAAPGNVVFTYASFGSAAAASATFGVTCTNYFPYTMALDATSGTLLGVNYTLALSASSATGSGAQQTHTISGNIAAGQSGTCATGTCSATQPRTLTITY
jgi:spore coat protein U-like protein